MSIWKNLFGGGSNDAAPSAHKGDGLVLKQLQKLGANLSQPRDARFYVYAPTEEAANAVANELVPQGYKVEVSPAAKPTKRSWLALATKDSVINEASLSEVRKLLEEIAARLNGEYDGWEAAAKP